MERIMTNGLISNATVPFNARKRVFGVCEKNYISKYRVHFWINHDVCDMRPFLVTWMFANLNIGPIL